jgi:hypothetical protein
LPVKFLPLLVRIQTLVVEPGFHGGQIIDGLWKFPLIRVVDSQVGILVGVVVVVVMVTIIHLIAI